MVVVGLAETRKGNSESVAGVVLFPALGLALLYIYRSNSFTIAAISSQDGIWWTRQARWRGPIPISDITALDAVRITSFVNKHQSFMIIAVRARTASLPQIRLTSDLRRMSSPDSDHGVNIRLSEADAPEFLSHLTKFLQGSNGIITESARDLAGM